MAVEQGKLKTPEENYEDAALELALYRMLRHEHEMVKANSSEDDEKETQRIAAESTPRIFALIERRTKRREGNSFKSCRLRRVGCEYGADYCHRNQRPGSCKGDGLFD